MPKNSASCITRRSPIIGRISCSKEKRISDSHPDQGRVFQHNRRIADEADRDRERRKWPGKRAFLGDTCRRGLRPEQSLLVCKIQADRRERFIRTLKENLLWVR